jgi:hypothetical protein
VLTLAECVAPAGKTVCQEREFDLLFLSGADCEVALEHLISLKEESPNIIVNRDKSRCAPSARERDAFESLEAINEAYKDKVGWHLPGPDEDQPAATRVAYEDRLAKLKSCEESDGVAPCKIGEIIIEETSSESVEVWRRD